MTQASDKKYLKIIPQMFATSISDEVNMDSIWVLLRDFLNFDEGYIFLTNPDFITLKSSFNPQKHIEDKNCFEISSKFVGNLFKKEDYILDKDEEFLKYLRFKDVTSSMILKLSIRDAVFGFLMLNLKRGKFNKEEMDSMKPVSCVLAYLIKDLELSSVFKIQLDALKNAMSEVNTAYKTIKEQNLKILAADKVKNEFLANISHELRTPLNAIIGFSDILANKLYGELNPQQEGYVQDIQASGIHLLGMINGILDISKIEAKAMKLIKREFEVAFALDEVCNIVRPLAQQKQISINKVINTDISFYGDYQKFQQIMYNLLSNAIKFTDSNGKICIEATSTKKYLILKVKDTGIGIDKKYHKKIFDKFVQLEDAYTKTKSSTGLGLAITKEFVEMHKGKITIESEVGKGSAFIVKLPLHVE